MKRNRAKHKAIRGLKYRSKFESSIAGNLSSRKVPFEYETVELPYTIEKTYNPDFMLDNGIIIEAKGVLTSTNRQTALAVREQNPDADVRFLFQRASNRLNKNSKTTYGEWATKNGFKWANGYKVPLEWIKE